MLAPTLRFCCGVPHRTRALKSRKIGTWRPRVESCTAYGSTCPVYRCTGTPAEFPRRPGQLQRQERHPTAVDQDGHGFVLQGEAVDVVHQPPRYGHDGELERMNGGIDLTSRHRGLYALPCLSRAAGVAAVPGGGHPPRHSACRY